MYLTWPNFSVCHVTTVHKSYVTTVTIFHNYPGTAILGNDDFKDDTLTGADTSQRTNVMFVQRKDIINPSSETSCPVVTMATREEMRDITLELHKIQPYKTAKRGLPAVRKICIIASNTQNQRIRGMIHSLARLDCNDDPISAEYQTI